MLWDDEAILIENGVIIGDIKTAKQVLEKWGAFKNKLKASEFRSGADDWCGRMQQNAFSTMQGMLEIKTERLQHFQSQAVNARNELAAGKLELARSTEKYAASQEEVKQLRKRIRHA